MKGFRRGLFIGIFSGAAIMFVVLWITAGLIVEPDETVEVFVATYYEETTEEAEIEEEPEPPPTPSPIIPLPDIEIPVWELEEFFAELDVSVFFENLATGFIFEHNADRVFFGASATKAPFALYIYTKAARGETNLDSIHTFQAGDYWHGSGFIRLRYEPGASFSQRQLLNLMLVPSDNIATRMLRRVHGLVGYKEFIESIGGNPNFVQNLTYSHISAREAGILMRETYRFFRNDCDYAREFKQNMLSNRYPFIISDYPLASKSGWADNFGGAYHDMAIVFADSPYVLIILSTLAGNWADRNLYEQISMFIQEFNSEWF